MPSKKQYNLVQNDENDTRIPLHSEEAFHRGIVFHAKFIGSMEVPRPTSRMEIVAAMRRIRYEFKAKGIKKKKVTLEVSVDGLKVTLRKKKRRKKQHQWLDDSKLALMHHPIYRIFYVSHDSHDLKIFSYIARDGTGNSFRCNVFKSSKKSQAMRVVRTVGQAFEVCHKLSLTNPASGGKNNNNNNNSINDEEEDENSQCNNSERDANSDATSRENRRQRRDSRDHEDGEDDYEDEFACLRQHRHNNRQSSPSSVHKDISLLGDSVDESILDQPCPQIRSHHGDVVVTSSPADTTNTLIGQSPLIGEHVMNSAELTALKHEVQLLRERLEQQSQQTRAAMAHARLLQDQLAAETAARVEAQARTHQLLVQNKELLEHIGALVSHLREHERSAGGVASSPTPTSPAQGTGDLGQCNPASTWDTAQHCNPVCSAYPYYHHQPPPSAYGYANSLLNYADELRYQAQLWDNVRLAVGNSTYAAAAPQLAPPHHLPGPGLGLPPTGRARPTLPPLSPSTLPRPSSRPHLRPAFQQQRSRSLDRPHRGTASPKEVSFIEPLPAPPDARSYREEAVQTEAAVYPEPPVILLTEPNNGPCAEEEDESGLSERDDELPELPGPAIRRRNSQ